MPRENVASLNEQSFILEALREGQRLDGRSFDAFRELQITFGDEFGAVDVQLGKTQCVTSSHMSSGKEHLPTSCGS